MNEGWIKLYRTLKKWEWYGDPVSVALWIHLLISANWEDKMWRGKLVKRGELITSYKHLADEVGTSIQHIRTRLNNFESTHNLTRLESGRKYTHIRIIGYEDYQVNTAANTQITLKQHSTNTQLTTTKEYKNIRNKEVGGADTTPIFLPPTEEEVKAYVDEKNLVIDAERFYLYYEAKGWNGIHDWKAKAREWNVKDRAEGKRKEVKGNNDYTDRVGV